MIPYITFRWIVIGPISVDVTALLVAAAILIGHVLFVREAGKRGFDEPMVAWLSAVMVMGGLILGHLMKLLYLPDPWAFVQKYPAELVRLLRGQASFGGLFGGLLAGWLYLRWRKVDGKGILRLMDCLALVFPYAWFFGRLHCAVAHDHPGVRTDSWLGVKYPDAVRFDLGMLEVLFLPLLMILFWVLRKRERAPGFFLAVFLVVYGVFRIGLDQLHVEVVRHWGLSMDQWAALTAIGVGGILFFAGLKSRAS